VNSSALLSLGTLLVLLGLTACIESVGELSECGPAEEAICTCADGAEGGRICRRDGTYSETCFCTGQWTDPWSPANPDPVGPNNNSNPDPGNNSNPDPNNNSNPDPSNNSNPDPSNNSNPDPSNNSNPDPGNNSNPDPNNNSGPKPEAYCYEEVWHDGADLAPAQTLFGRGDWRGAAKEALRIRWPAGAYLVQRDESMLNQFGESSNFSSLMESFGVIIHEGVHLYDYGNAIWDRDMAYFITDSQTIKTPWIDGFPRSELSSMLPDDSTDLYRRTYLTGEQGERGFSELMDEQNCYIADMAATAVVGDAIQSAGWSARDGAVAFLLYMQLFLRRARTEYSAVYNQMKSDTSIVDLVRTQWLRAHFWLAISDRYPEQGIRDEDIRQHVYTAENLAEIELFLGHAVDASPCLPDGPA
jgi:hypothetical protein